MEEERPSPEPQWAFEERVVVATFNFPWEAEVVRARLEAEGLSPVLADDHLIALDWFVAQAVGGVKLLVHQSEAEQARALLAETAELPEIGLATDDDPAQEPRCPRCQSTNLSYARWSRAGFVGTLLAFGFPLPIPHPRYRCGRCKAEWSPEEVER
ncbi:MAG TPA: DUF2007 domain-containing protein [Thermoanaerobaculia bacterium]|nr:DUF2007 domain-containing protein [Thermoanaerobaculia bacterium]